VGTGVALALRLHLTPAEPGSPPGSLLLAVRACRRALAANPDDAGAYLLLGEAYFRLARQTPERSWQAALPRLASIRVAQALAALEQAVQLRPDLDQAHALLAQLYYERGHLDRALDHLRERLRLAVQEARVQGPDAAAAAERRRRLQADVAAMEDLVRSSEKVYEANTEGNQEPSKVLARARLAVRHGLARQALEMLLASSPAIFGKDGTRLQLELMLLEGRAAEVRAWLSEAPPAILGRDGFVPYHWLLAQASAACGDYDGADREVDQMTELVRRVQLPPDKLLAVRPAVAVRATQAALTRPVPGAGPAGLAVAAYLQFEALRHLGGPAELLRQEADSHVLRGLLALEAGDVEAAEQHCRAALAVWGSDARARTGAGLDFNARPIAQYVLRLLEGER
jgi:tetratricopeptide (TPR) repeat protein